MQHQAPCPRPFVLRLVLSEANHPLPRPPTPLRCAPLLSQAKGSMSSPSASLAPYPTACIVHSFTAADAVMHQAEVIIDTATDKIQEPCSWRRLDLVCKGQLIDHVSDSVLHSAPHELPRDHDMCGCQLNWGRFG